MLLHLEVSTYMYMQLTWMYIGLVGFSPGRASGHGLGGVLTTSIDYVAYVKLCCIINFYVKVGRSPNYAQSWL